LKLEKPNTRAMKLASKAEARERTESLRRDYRSMECAWMRLGASVQVCIEAHVPEALEMTAQAWGESVFGEGWSKIKRARQAYNGLKHLQEAEIMELSEGNAVTLSRLPPKMRATNLDLAKRLSVKDFRQAVAVKLESMGVPRTRTCHFDGVNLSEDRYELIVEQMKRTAELLELDPDEPSTRSTCLWAWASSIGQTADELLRADWGLAQNETKETVGE